MRKEAASRGVDYRIELDKLGQYREEVFAFVEDGREHMGEGYEDYCFPFRTLYRPARYAAPTVRGVASEDHAGVVPLILDVERVFGYPCTAEQIYRGSPATLEKANDELHRMMRQVRYRPYGSDIPMGKGWYEDAVAKLLGGPHKSSKELFLHSELWKKRGASKEMWALMAMLDGRRSPKEVIEREVWLRATGRDTTHVPRRRAQPKVLTVAETEDARQRGGGIPAAPFLSLRVGLLGCFLQGFAISSSPSDEFAGFSNPPRPRVHAAYRAIIAISMQPY